MKIAWASPIAKRSAIGRFSVEVVDALIARGNQVDFIRTEVEQEQAGEVHPCLASITPWRKVTPDWLASHDIVIVNVGDNFLFHAGVFPLLKAAPCVGVFHDFYLHNLFLGWLADGGGDVRAHEDALVLTYGEGARAAAPRLRAGAVPLEQIASDYPMTEWIGAQCAGAMTHSKFYAQRLLDSCPGPVATQHLAWRSRREFPHPQPKAEAEKLVVLTIGVVKSNKCVDRMTTAIAGDPALSARINYRVAGPVADAERARLEELAQTMGYEGLTLLGGVDDAQLEDEIIGADVISCLRRPVLEGGSASAIEGILSKRPVIVADAGFYAELPDAFVAKVGADIEIDDLRAALHRLVGDFQLRLQMGVAGSEWGAEAFSAQTYARAVEALAAETVAVAPIAAVAARYGRAFHDLGLAPSDPNVRRIADRLGALFAVG